MKTPSGPKIELVVSSSPKYMSDIENAKVDKSIMSGIEWLRLLVFMLLLVYTELKIS